VVIAGATGAVDEALVRCKEAGARRGVLLPVSGPFHCELMKPAQRALADVLNEMTLAMPQIPVVHNVDGMIAADIGALRAKLVAQLAEPVLWTRCTEAMIAGGVERLVECGPGTVLSGLVKRINRSVTTDSLGTLDGLRAALD
jgi:[acyl-carrier-protein] S-malonyltransferase